jgi:hypothetical protein
VVPGIHLVRKSVKLPCRGCISLPNLSAGVARTRPLFIHRSQKELVMRAFIAACIAVGILWAVDVQFNDGRYSDVVKVAVKNVLQR